ncbi:MAG: DUF296 domain-containing protein [Prochlorococcus sp.]|nr:DUF296 domain-containing protein [Prochlorococcus sp.]
MRSLASKLPAGSDLRLSLEQLAKQEDSSGFVLGVVGNLSRAVFQCPEQPEPTVLEGNLEIITLNGTVSPSGVHLHLSVSDGSCQVLGGHLEPGSLVLKGVDVLLGLIDEPQSQSPLNDIPKQNGSPRVEVAVLQGCPWSARTLRMLRSLDIQHTVKTIENDEEFNLVKQRSGVSTFPQIFIDGEFLGGYEALAELHGSGELESFR